MIEDHDLGTIDIRLIDSLSMDLFSENTVRINLREWIYSSIYETLHDTQNSRKMDYTVNGEDWDNLHMQFLGLL